MHIVYVYMYVCIYIYIYVLPPMPLHFPIFTGRNYKKQTFLGRRRSANTFQLSGPDFPAFQFFGRNFRTSVLLNFPTFQLSNFPTFQLSNFPTFQLSNIPTFQLSNVPTLKLFGPNFGMWESWKVRPKKVGKLECWKVGMLESWNVHCH